MTAKTRYRCWQCGSERWLPERPLSPTPTVRLGCDSCGGLRTWRPVGTAHPRDLSEVVADV